MSSGDMWKIGVLAIGICTGIFAYAVYEGNLISAEGNLSKAPISIISAMTIFPGAPLIFLTGELRSYWASGHMLGSGLAFALDRTLRK